MDRVIALILMLICLSIQPLCAQQDTLVRRVDTYKSSELQKALYIQFYNTGDTVIYSYDIDEDEVLDTLLDEKNSLIYQKADCYKTTVFAMKPIWFSQERYIYQYAFDDEGKKTMICFELFSDKRNRLFVHKIKKWLPTGELRYESVEKGNRTHRYKRYTYDGHNFASWGMKTHKILLRYHEWALFRSALDGDKIKAVKFKHGIVRKVIQYDSDGKRISVQRYKKKAGMGINDVFSPLDRRQLVPESRCMEDCFPHRFQPIENPNIEVYRIEQKD